MFLPYLSAIFLLYLFAKYDFSVEICLKKERYEC